MSAVAATAGSTGLLLAGSASPRTGHFGFAILGSPLGVFCHYWSILGFVLFVALSDGTLWRHDVMMFGYDTGKKVTMSRQNAVYARTVVARPLMKNT